MHWPTTAGKQLTHGGSCKQIGNGGIADSLHKFSHRDLSGSPQTPGWSAATRAVGDSPGAKGDPFDNQQYGTAQSGMMWPWILALVTF
jgi:hypothetical protein